MKRKRMINLIGEYECRLDAKGRLVLPSALKKQIPQEADERFVINRGFEKCLTLFPLNVWRVVSEEVNRLNMYVKMNREFMRFFFRGASELQLDGASRLLLPKTLLEYAGIDKDVILFAHGDRIEVWDKKLYEPQLQVDSEVYSALAEQVMGQVTKQAGQGNVP
ncbi:MAG: division/cell wall cluster transcriptional repressor MraZ [Lentimicrobiaceae bacterium]|nr:division/cell wall cluster transcriptional repressor MraZ [Lentimicrobiaceae bacterium]